MNTDEFKKFLNNELNTMGGANKKLTENAIKARLSRANRIEKELNINLDDQTKSIYNLKQLKQTLKDSYSSSVSSTLYNTATRYYKFIHGVEPEKKHKDYLKL